MCKPWKKTLIIKLLGRKVGFCMLETKLFQLWIRDGVMEITDLTNDYYLVKFSAYLDYEFAFTIRLWLIYNHYLTVRPWDPGFDPDDDEIGKVAVWVRVPSLPPEFFDTKILTFPGNRIGKTLKVDVPTIDQSRGNYA